MYGLSGRTNWWQQAGAATGPDRVAARTETPSGAAVRPLPQDRLAEGTDSTAGPRTATGPTDPAVGTADPSKGASTAGSNWAGAQKCPGLAL
jgi:hypothetical protein